MTSDFTLSFFSFMYVFADLVQRVIVGKVCLVTFQNAMFQRYACIAQYVVFTTHWMACMLFLLHGYTMHNKHTYLSSDFKDSAKELVSQKFRRWRRWL
uniref:Uncharacterized protein n=1 Tax=Rhipicephalus microplus TaxID=6941 RepID=A0A6M2DCJ8_RHIMP